MGSTSDSPDGAMSYEEMWTKAIEEYYKAAGYENKEFFYKENEVEIKAEVEKVKKIAQATGSSAGSRDIVWNFAPQAIDIALQGASIAFPPAAIIGTVTNLFTKAGKEYNELFSRMEGFRGMIQFYFEELDRRQEHERSGQPGQAHLKAIDFQRLCCHLRICGFITRYARKPDQYHIEATGKDHELQSKSKEPAEEKNHRRRNVIKGLFASEKPGTDVEQQFGKARKRDKAMLFFDLLTGSNEISNEFNTLEELTAKYNEARNSDVHRDMKTLMKDSHNRSEKDTLEKCLDTIKSSLDIQDGHKSWTALHSKLSPVAGMGDWIIGNDLFKSWGSFGVPGESPVLKLEGPEKYGKTFLCHRTISHLQDNRYTSFGEGMIDGSPITPGKEAKASSIIASVAYFYFGKGGSDEKDKATLRDAIAAIMWQLVQEDVLYRQFVSKKCDSSGPLMKKEELWKLLQPRQTSIFFIVIDGIDHAAEISEDLKILISNIASGGDAKNRLRVLLSGTLPSLACIENEGSTIDLSDAEEARSDVKLFVEHILNSQIQPSVSELEKEIPQHDAPEALTKRLLGMLSGVRNYDFIDFLLGQMSKSFFPDVRLKDLANDLTKGGEFALVKFQIEHLNQVLRPSDIENFNEILPWFILPKHMWPTMRLIEDVLAIHHGGLRPILKVKAYISQTFGDLVEVDRQCFRSSSLDGYYSGLFKITKERSVPDDAKHSNQAWEKDALHPSEIALVKRFLKTVCDEPLYRKFGFDKFFKEKEDPLPGFVHFDPIDGHVKMITTCLEAACNEKKEEFSSIHEHTAVWLPWHLSEIYPSMLSMSQAERIAEVMPLLRNFFRRRDVIETWLRPQWTYGSWERWFLSKKRPDCVMTWFNDPVFTRVSEVQELRKSVRNLWDDKELLEEAAKVAAFNWLRLKLPQSTKSKPDEGWICSGEPGAHFDDMCVWVLGYLDEWRCQEPGKGGLGAFWAISKPSVQSILAAERWAQQALDATEKTPEWNLRMAKTLAHFSYIEEAMERLELVASSDTNMEFTCDVYEGISAIFHFIPEASRKSVSGILQPHLDDLKLRLQDADHSIAQRTMASMSSIYHTLGNTSEAIECCKISLKSFPANGHQFSKFRLLHDLLSWMFSASRWSDLVTEMSALDSQDLIGLVSSFADTEFYDKIAIALIKTGSSSSKYIFQQALQQYTEEDQSQEVIRASDCARVCQALILLRAGLQNDLDEAIQLWQTVLHHPCKAGLKAPHSILEDQSEANLALAFYLKAKTSGQQDISDEDQKIYFYSSEGTERAPYQEYTSKKALLVARFHYIRGRKELAKQELKRKILRIKDILSDDDDSNDVEGYNTLATVLISLERYDDARIAFMLHFGYRIESDPANSAPKEVGWKWWCDGYCGTNWNSGLSEDFYYCKDCLGISFDKRCMDKVLEGSLGWNACGKDHEFLRVPKWGEESSRELKERAPDVKQWKDSVLKSLLGEEDEDAEPDAAGVVDDSTASDCNDRSDALQE